MKLLVATLVAIIFATLIAFAGSDNGSFINGIPVFIICAISAFIINWLAFIPASIATTERYYDLTGSITYLVVIFIACYFSEGIDARAVLVSIMVAIWTLRLGWFLFLRIQHDGKDSRFEAIKVKPQRFFVTWTLQALWVVITAACALVIITSTRRVPIDLFAIVGALIWLLGFTIEVIADQQKSNFKKNSANTDQFISIGLWSYSRHPNYFGEIILWLGIAVMALPVMSGYQWVTLISPIFVYSLIRYVSGVNKLEAKAERKWGNNADYQKYKAETPMLVLWPFK